ncbi:MAG: helix-turn-helix transcriptional regulator [Flavobacteriaceae bacterium]|nr:helix-turn-helix transcriptional regulator [Flavobacteriaceae bacterium]
MKVLPFKIPKSSTDTLIIEEDKGEMFYDKLHQHEEIQLSYIISGKGTFIVGDTIKNYETNDILIFGSNVPHVLNSDVESNVSSHMISLFFSLDSFGEEFFNLPEFQKVKAFLSKAQLGLKLKNINLKEKFEAITKEGKLKRFLLFLEVLENMMESEVETIASFSSKKIYTDNEGKRMSAIFDLALNNYHKDITLEDVSDVATMTPNAFCRYFKQRTNKTFVQFLTEIRIEKSCNLLSKNNELSIAEIAYQCGFKNISNYNRKFKGTKDVTPTEYRRRMSL